MNRSLSLSLTLVGLAWMGSAVAAAPAVPPASSPEAALAVARAAAQDFSGRLRARLQEAMRGEGPVAAVEVCRVEAPAIAAQVMAGHGVLLGRMAVPGRNRHPDQDAGGWQAAVLADFAAAVEDGAPAAAQIHVAGEGLPAGTALRFARGIETEQPCLACHGRALAADVLEAVARHYPSDRATGFAPGELRGLLWVEVPTPADRP